jgi:cytochrome c oxidase subunit 4
MFMSNRIVAPTTYYGVFALLILLTALTVGLSFADLRQWHTMVGVGIGVIKAVLVALFFMHLLYSPRMNWIALGAGLFWFGIMMVLTLSDYLTRAWQAY